MTIGLGLLATLGTGTNSWVASGYMLVLGLGLGMVMQVLVLAVQNSVDYRDLGVGTSGTTLFRSIGGAVGVSLFGAIFASTLASALSSHMPGAGELPAATDPVAIQALPTALREVYLDAFTAALHPVFLSAAIIAGFGFLASWLLKEIPLRESAGADTVGESFAMPRDATSLSELESILARLSSHQHRWNTYQRISERLGVALQPDEIWLLIQLSRDQSSPPGLDTLAAGFSIARRDLDAIGNRLCAQGLAKHGAHADDRNASLHATDAGCDTYERIVEGFRQRLSQFVARWSPEEHAEVRSMLETLARELVSELPREQAQRKA